jgi:hypothetical protein
MAASSSNLELNETLDRDRIFRQAWGPPPELISFPLSSGIALNRSLSSHHHDHRFSDDNDNRNSSRANATYANKMNINLSEVNQQQRYSHRKRGSTEFRSHSRSASSSPTSSHSPTSSSFTHALKRLRVSYHHAVSTSTSTMHTEQLSFSTFEETSGPYHGDILQPTHDDAVDQNMSISSQSISHKKLDLGKMDSNQQEFRMITANPVANTPLMSTTNQVLGALHHERQLRMQQQHHHNSQQQQHQQQRQPSSNDVHFGPTYLSPLDTLPLPQYQLPHTSSSDSSLQQSWKPRRVNLHTSSKLG